MTGLSGPNATPVMDTAGNLYGPRILACSSWSVIASYFPRVASAVCKSLALDEARKLYRVIWSKYPTQGPEMIALRSLAQSRESLGLPGQAARFVIFLSETRFVAAATCVAEIQQMLAPDENDVRLPARLIEVVSAFIGSEPTAGGLTHYLREFGQLMKGLPESQVELCLCQVGVAVSDRVRANAVGLWKADPESDGRLGWVREFAYAAENFPKRWDVQGLTAALAELPQDANGRPLAYPGALWGLLYCWLRGDGLSDKELANYQVEVGHAWLDMVLNGTNSTEGLRRCGRWLRESRADETVFVRIAGLFLAALDATDGELPRSLEAITALCGPMQTAGGFVAVLRKWLELGAWRSWSIQWEEIVLGKWKHWLALQISSPDGQDWRNGWAELVLLGAVFDSDLNRSSQWGQEMRAMGRHLPPVSVDSCLLELEARVLSGAFNPKEASQRLTGLLAYWGDSNTPVAADTWFRCCKQLEANQVLTQEDALRLRTAVLRRERRTLNALFDTLWPRVPMQLLFQDRIPDFRGLVRLVAEEGLLTEQRSAEFARRLFDRCSPDAPSFDRVTCMATTIFAPTAQFAVSRWEAVRSIPGLAPERILGLARSLFEPLPTQAQDTFREAVRDCLLYAAARSADAVLPPLAALL